MATVATVATVDRKEESDMSAFPDPERALLALLNLSEGWSGDDGEMAARVGDFVATYGTLRKLVSTKFTLADLWDLKAVKEEALGAPQVLYYSKMFALAVSPERGHRTLNLLLEEIFQTPAVIDGVVHPTALIVDIAEGTVTPVSRDLLDALAVKLLHSRKLIARCALCSKFFYRQFSKDKYCSTHCASEARAAQQTAWVAAKRAKRAKGEQAKRKGRKAR